MATVIWLSAVALLLGVHTAQGDAELPSVSSVTVSTSPAGLSRANVHVHVVACAPRHECEVCISLGSQSLCSWTTNRTPMSFSFANEKAEAKEALAVLHYHDMLTKSSGSVSSLFRFDVPLCVLGDHCSPPQLVFDRSNGPVLQGGKEVPLVLNLHQAVLNSCGNKQQPYLYTVVNGETDLVSLAPVYKPTATDPPLDAVSQANVKMSSVLGSLVFRSSVACPRKAPNEEVTYRIHGKLHEELLTVVPSLQQLREQQNELTRSLHLRMDRWLYTEPYASTSPDPGSGILFVVTEER